MQTSCYWDSVTHALPIAGSDNAKDLARHMRLTDRVFNDSPDLFGVRVRDRIRVKYIS